MREGGRDKENVEEVMNAGEIESTEKKMKGVGGSKLLHSVV